MDAENEICYPSSWKKPSDVLQNFRKRRKALQNRIQNNVIKKDTSKLKSCNHSLTTPAVNPFRKFNNEKSNFLNSELEISSDTTLFQLLHLQQSNKIKNQIPKHEILPVPSDKEEKVVKEKELKGESELPIDWSLKLHLRFLSPTPFLWNVTALKTTEEASGTTGFVRCLHSHQGELDTSASAQLHQHCLVWLHPSLPWLNLFPRHKEHSAGNNLISSNSKIQEALFKDWGNSVRSLFQLLRSRQCPYFYVCAPNFTVLFRSAGIGGISEVNAMITPTTKGLRQSLKEEGIEYSMPLFRQQLETLKTPKDLLFPEQVGEKNLLNDSIVEENEDEVDLWMSNAGLQNSEFLSSLQKKKNQEDKPLDKHPESLVYIEGAEVQALYNFLLNARNLCIATSGPSSGVPATLLAPVAFQGGTLKPLSVKQHKVHKDQEVFHCLDLRGPILPHVTPMLIELSKTLLDTSYTIKYSTLQSTVPFSTNINTPFVPSAFAKQSLMDCGLHPDVLNRFCSSGAKKCQLMEEITYKDGLFVWR